MNAHRLFRSLRVALPALILALVLVAGLALAEEPHPQGPITTEFTYQGRLTDDAGNPIDDDLCRFRFELYDGDTGGLPLTSQELYPVAVSKGLFTVKLSLGDNFDGNERWLKVQVKCTGDESFVELSPRQKLTATPYALYAANADRLDGQHAAAFSLPGHNHWSENWSGTETGLILQGGTTGLWGGGTSYGVRGSTASTGAFDSGVFGEATAPAGIGAASGVRGSSAAPTGAGLMGLATHTTGSNYGVYAQSNSPAGTGVYAAGGIYGVEATASGATASGVRGYASDPTGVNYGVYGISSSGAGYGIYGEGNVGARFVGRGFDIIQGWDASEQVFRVTQGGAVVADGGFQCGQSITCDADYTWCNEVMLQPCLLDESEADFAELMPAARGLEPGDLLVIGLDGKLARSTQPYQPSVVGVYSTRPSYVGNSRYWAQDGYAPLALTGVVPVKVSAENGAIRPGDLLTASSIPGHAMRCEGIEQCFSRTVGKALAGLDKGTGVILMLVTLQ